MLWWVASTGFHIVLLGIGLASTTTISSSYLHIDHASHLKPVVFLSLILAILTIFEVLALALACSRITPTDLLLSTQVLVIYAVILIFMEKNRLEAQPERTVFSDSIDASPERGELTISRILIKSFQSDFDQIFSGPALHLLPMLTSFLLLRKVLQNMKT